MTRDQLSALGTARDCGRRIFFAGLIGALLACSLAGASAAEPCEPVLGRLVSVQGSVQLVRGKASAQAELNAALCAGDSLRVLPRGRAAVALSNETVLRLDQGTTMTLGAPSADSAPSMDLRSGALYVITRTPRRFKVTTPFVNANVEGTEFLVELDRPVGAGAEADAERAWVTVYEGRILADNGLGNVVLTKGQTAIATRGAAPSRALAVRPKDAVAWTLYVPTILDFQFDAGASNPSGGLQQIGDPYRSARVAEALAALEASPSSRTPRSRTQQAGLLLLLGRIEDAKQLVQPLLTEDLQRESGSTASDAHALASIIAVVENDKARALVEARAATTLAPESPAAWLALSYAEQAAFSLPRALASAQRADAEIKPAMVTVRSIVQPNPRRALALSRVAELYMANGDLRASQSAAGQALQANPQVSRIQTVFGFAHLLQIDTAKARQAFERAIELDQNDPIPRLGLGLAKVRDGDLEGGRVEIEIATGLDPDNALVRSYLGKAYYEEKRDKLSGVQFELAKQADPNDPTPYLYDAIRLLADNRPVEALRELQKSVELNHNRAVYRSRLLLDQDRATRQINMASVYGELGSNREAIALASQSVSDDPSNYSAHRFLSEAYAKRDRHDIARTSELLQAQLLQPLSLNAIAPELPFTDVSVPSASAQAAVFSDESSSMFERNRLQALVGGLAGNLDTKGSRAIVSGLRGPVSASVGYFDYATDGFRANNDIHHRIWNAFLQFSVSPSLSLQTEYRERHTRQGDVTMNFDPAYFSDRNRKAIDQHSTRLGATYRPSPTSMLVVSVVRSEGQFDDSFFLDETSYGGVRFDDSAMLYELQYQGQWSLGNIVAGAGRSRASQDTTVRLTTPPSLFSPCGPVAESCDNSAPSTLRQWNGYVYANLRPLSNLSATVGLSRDHYDDGNVRISKWNPKFGVRFDLNSRVTLRAATFGTVKRSLVTQQTIEPTQVVGFNQLYDDQPGSINRFLVAAIDARIASNATAGIEVGRQRSLVGSGSEGVALTSIPQQTLRSEWLRLDVHWRPDSGFVFSLGAATERFVWDDSRGDIPSHLRTTRVPLTMRTFLPGGFFGDILTTGVWQQVSRGADSAAPAGSKRFVVVDLSLGYRLPLRRGTLSLDIKNLFGSKFSYQDDNFRSTEDRLSPYVPVRRVWMKASLAF